MPGPEPPPRARLAAVGALTLALGLAAGLLYGGGRSGVVRLEVPDGEDLIVHCGPVSTQGPGPVIEMAPSTVRCDVTARLGHHEPLTGALDARRPGSYRCRAQDGELRCTGP